MQEKLSIEIEEKDDPVEIRKPRFCRKTHRSGKKKKTRHRSLLSYQDRDQKSKPPKEDHHIIMIEQSLNIIELDNEKRDMDSDRHVKTK